MKKEVKKAAPKKVVKAPKAVIEPQTIEEVVKKEAPAPVEATEEKQPKPLGRRPNPESARQKKLAQIAEMKAQGIVIKRGRQPNPDSKNQQRKMRMEALRAEGIVLKKGRPKMVKTEEPATTNAE